MKKNLKFPGLYFILFLCIPLVSCERDDEPASPDSSEAQLIIKLDVDPDQLRLGNNGQASPVPEGNAGQHPVFNKISAHYLEFAPNAFTPLGDGEILYHAEETGKGGENAIDFDKSIVITPGEEFLRIPIKDIKPGNYKWVRLSLSYQNLNAKLDFQGNTYEVTIAGFVGFNTYISEFVIKNESIEVNDNKLQGYFGFESIAGVLIGQTPPGATTVPNPIFETSPIPAGSCVVTGKFNSALSITGHETEDISLVMSLSTNNSVEWRDLNANGKWDIGGANSESLVDMGLRGLVPKIE